MNLETESRCVRILQRLRALESELQTSGVRHVSVFGSVARGEETANSDIDLALDLTPGTVPTGFQFIAHIERLKRRLTSALRRDVDIVADGKYPSAASNASAIGKSNRPPSFGKSAGARFTVIRPGGQSMLTTHRRRSKPNSRSIRGV